MEQLIDKCLLCLASSNNQSIEIFSENGENLKIAEIISKHFWFQVKEYDPYARKICTKCWSKIYSFHEFYNLVECTHKEFLINIRIKSEEPFSPKKNFSDYFTEPCDSPEAIEECEITPDIVLHPNPDKGEKRERKQNEIQKTQSVTEISETDALVTEPEYNKKSVDCEELKIPPYFDMSCDLCNAAFDSFQRVKKHYKMRHKISKGYIKCCSNKKFYKRSSIIDHIKWHLNPNLFQCNICEKSFIEKRTLTAHMLRHTSNEDRNFVCDKCSKRFSRQHLLNRHMIDVHPVSGKKFVCELCQKNFKLEATLKAHISNVHERMFEQICDICAKTFKTKQGFQEHLAAHTDTEATRVQCNYCRAWLKNRSSLNKHIKTHTDQPQKCEICNKMKPNRAALNHHKRTVHSAPIHQCNICDKTFKRSLALTEHIASHTGENLYTCPYCPKTFKSNSNMHKHRKQTHPEQWVQDRERRLATYLTPATQ